MKFINFVFISSVMILLLTACTRQSRPNEESAVLLKQKGEPLFKDKVGNGDSEVWTYSDQSYQIKDGKVKYKTRKATDAESSLQYWVQRWQGVDVLTQEVKLERHSPTKLQFRALEKNEEVIFEPDSGLVIEVIENAQ